MRSNRALITFVEKRIEGWTLPNVAQWWQKLGQRFSVLDLDEYEGLTTPTPFGSS